MDNTNNLLMIVAVLAVAIALVNLGITINKIGSLKELTGRATDQGDVNVTIINQAVINFNTSNVNWGSGAVDVGETYAILDTEAGNVTWGNWSDVTYSLSLQNDGNVNVSVNLSSNKNAVSFIGGGAEQAPSFKLKASDNESGSCVSYSTFSSFAEVTTSQQVACTNMGFNYTADLFNIDVQLIVPRDAVGVKGAVITATATSL